MTVSISEAFFRIAGHADYNYLPKPVIRTDRQTVSMLIDMIAEDMNAPSSGAFRHERIMFAGIEFVAEPDARETRDEWHEHFGALAEIWGVANK